MSGTGAGGPEPLEPPSRRRGEGGLPVTAMMTGVFAVLLCWTILAGVVLGAAAVVIGIVAYRQVQGDGTGRERLAVGGGVLGFIGLAVSVWLVVDQLR